ncbi:Dyp-type peroxidase [Nocardioides houyundeii]|uniref:Dyp-type peroxidase n=1 Tax=Nocardioides houyundeii TaxID=2045452 RepID=UPI0013B37AA8|nr:Dyp-type peroxidase [Nocardioides houyundeii]
MSPDRRQVLTSAAVVTGGALAASVIGRAVDWGRSSAPPGPRSTEDTQDSTQDDGHQSGVHRPADPQAYALLTVLDLETTTRAELGAMLRRLGEGIGAAAPAGSGDLTATVGVGPRVVRAAGGSLPGGTPLPGFAGDDRIPSSYVGGDLLLAVHGPDAAAVERVTDRLLSATRGRVRWAQAGSRSSAGHGRARNPLGFLDGVVVPRTDAELADDVWIPEGPAAGGTICVVRRLRLDVDGFRALPVRRQERVIGRRHSDGAPLSGGGPLDQVDLSAKTPDGEYVVPLHSHARAAHPSFTGSGLMLRRSYAYQNGAEDRGLLFISFQRELATFVRTQQRLDEADELMGFSSPTASAAFLVLPGFDDTRPLGATLFG